MAKTLGKALVLWSGGAASTWALMQMLRTETAAVYAHHHIRKLPGQRAAQPAHERRLAAVRRMRQTLAESGADFAYSESFADHSGFPVMARDTVSALFHGAQAALSWGFRPSDALIFGTAPDRAADNSAALAEEMRFLSVLHRYVTQAVFLNDAIPRILWLEPPRTDAALMAELPESIREDVIRPLQAVPD